MCAATGNTRPPGDCWLARDKGARTGAHDKVGLDRQFQRNESARGEALALPHHQCCLRTDV
jgi:hypothetical protein